MTESAHQKQPEDQALPPTDDVNPQEVLSAWESAFNSIKTQLRSYATLIAADFRLSIKAIVLVVVCIAAMACLGLIIWLILLVGLTYGLNSLGLDWFWCLLIVLGLNIGALLVVKQILSSALKSIEMKSSAEVILNSVQGTVKNTNADDISKHQHQQKEPYV
ncbi:hypothetical protein [Colwellia echini]|uniref:Phage holin family protein n=1 Tax=Colwellia echini TaxID=1982103 RepID=A0ABY3MWX5_9GAMM|nr:hypothetical protein [Colwellia echini]TYK65731.1 hypothetical protein CWS31_008760 [Colwellia echini]